ncbi:MAG: peptide deformylase [Verrucomicrobia bacterium]|nr:peptide deformylase [Verrucomicrobiota bacterium]
MILPIVYYGQKILRTKCSEVLNITPEIVQLVADMIETMDAKNGVGIAAPQVGRDLRIFIARDYQEKEDGETELLAPKVYINPKILSKSEEVCIETEGCLSIPGIREEVERPVSIVIEAKDLEGNLFTEALIGYDARIRMHENDHLNGVLFIDRLSSLKKKKIAPFLRKIEEKYKS